MPLSPKRRSDRSPSPQHEKKKRRNNSREEKHDDKPSRKHNSDEQNSRKHYSDEKSKQHDTEEHLYNNSDSENKSRKRNREEKKVRREDSKENKDRKHVSPDIRVRRNDSQEHERKRFNSQDNSSRKHARRKSRSPKRHTSPKRERVLKRKSESPRKRDEGGSSKWEVKRERVSSPQDRRDNKHDNGRSHDGNGDRRNDRRSDRNNNNNRSETKHELRTSPVKEQYGKPEEDTGKPVEKQKANFERSGKLAEDTNVYKGVVIKYNEPGEARKPGKLWRLYPFKADNPLKIIHLHRQSAYMIGRDRKIAEIPVDHPSCSKQHAVFQFRVVPYTKKNGDRGRQVKPYIIDLDSANGTFLNEERIQSRRYVELFEKDVLKFGFSQRKYVLLHAKTDTSQVEEEEDEDDGDSEEDE